MQTLLIDSELRTEIKCMQYNYKCARIQKNNRTLKIEKITNEDKDLSYSILYF